MHVSARKGWWILLAWSFVALAAQAQVRPAFFDYVRGDLDWYTIETEHFKVHFHADEEGRGSSRTAQVVARIAEEIYGPITSLYEHEPDTKVSFILKDYEDYSNGAAYFFDNMIEIWAPALDSPLRGDHNWLRNVITHEFTHMVQVQKTMKADRRMPFLYFQLLDYEDVRRPDVLYGYPNVIVTYPVPVLNNPAWLAEGTAQYQREYLDYDRWDTHRDMLLRTRLLAGKEMSLTDMGESAPRGGLQPRLCLHPVHRPDVRRGRAPEDQREPREVEELELRARREGCARDLRAGALCGVDDLAPGSL